MGSNLTLVASQNVLWLLHVKIAAKEQSGCDWSGTWAVTVNQQDPLGLALIRLFWGFFYGANISSNYFLSATLKTP